MLKLEVQNAAQKGKKIPLKPGLTIGNGASCTVRVHHADLHVVHARFFEEKGKMAVEAGDSEAAILLNGKVVLRADLRHGDELGIGPLRLKVINEAHSSSSTRLDELLAALEGGHQEIHDFAKEDLFYLVSRDPNLRKSITFTIPSRDKFIEQAQAFLARLVKNSGMDEMRVDGFMTCAKELILNAHRHGHEFDESKTITIAYQDQGDRVGLTITDQGKGFDHRAVVGNVRDKDAAQAARERYQAGGFGGLGFQLITRLAPDLAYNDAGNQVRFSIPKK
jgi:anti-sigma regulatory factor (Ser/Thr protein kinase)